MAIVGSYDNDYRDDIVHVSDNYTECAIFRAMGLAGVVVFGGKVVKQTNPVHSTHCTVQYLFGLQFKFGGRWLTSCQLSVTTLRFCVLCVKSYDMMIHKLSLCFSERHSTHVQFARVCL